MKIISVIILVMSSVIVSAPLIAQQALDPEQLKISPLKYKNSYIKLNDVYIHFRAGGSGRLDKAGYPLDRYVTFGAAKSGMRCFLRRDSASEALVAQFRNGDRMTIYGYVREPRIRFSNRRDTLKLMPIIEVSKMIKGWE
jgi:hypothetical protein